MTNTETCNVMLDSTLILDYRLCLLLSKILRGKTPIFRDKGILSAEENSLLSDQSHHVIDQMFMIKTSQFILFIYILYIIQIISIFNVLLTFIPF